ncbi:MAG: phosphatase PAP2 family protein [Acidobacteria bacterium]|nr:phosphatase PAP2 family protein [Acidobacteriota bacterium]
MRASEWIQLGSAITFAIASWLTPLTSRPLPRRSRWTVTALAAIAAVAIALAHLAAATLTPGDQAVLLDCLTIALFLVPYWQTGQFFIAPDHAIEDRLLAFDRRLLPRISATSGTSRSTIGFVLEMSYLSCYPLVPLGLAAIYAAGLRDKANGFWIVLLIATYICYAITPFVPAFPPRSLINEQPATTAPPNRGRLFNGWILQHGSIHAISFPSAHVASAFAIACVLLFYAPLFGAVFLIIAIMISLGAVIGRYHYALDVILGAVTALIVFLACYRHL